MFRNPHGLWLLLLIVPLLLARKRQPSVRAPVGNLYMWKDASSAVVNRVGSRLRRDRLLIVQLAFVAAAATAIASPVLPIGGRTVALVLDLSASMSARDGARSRLEHAVDVSLAIVDSLPRGSRVRLVAARAVPEQLGEFRASDSGLARAIRALDATAGSADLIAAIDAARGSDGAPARVYVVSDGRRLAGVEWIGVGRPASNLAITNLAVRRPPGAAREMQVLVEAGNFSTQDRDVEIELAVDGTAATRRAIRVPAGRSESLVIDAAGSAGIVRATLLADDPLAADNVRFAVASPDAPIRVLLSGGSFFVEKALAANPNLRVAPFSSGLDYDVVVCEGCAEPPPGTGGALVIPEPLRSGEDSRPLVWEPRVHPLAKGLASATLHGVLVPGGRNVDDSRVLARIEGEPAILAYEVSGRRLVEFHLDASDPRLAVTTEFPVLMANAVEWLAPSQGNRRELIAGEALRWRVAGGAGRAEVIGPTGGRVEAAAADDHLVSAAMHAAGVYTVRGAGGAEQFVVNTDTRSESDLRSADAATPIGPSGVDTDDASRSVVVLPLILAALALLVLDGWIRHRAVAGA